MRAILAERRSARNRWNILQNRQRDDSADRNFDGMYRIFDRMPGWKQDR